MLEVKNLHATINGKEILGGINLIIKTGEVHAIMGPNDSDKSTLGAVPVDSPMYEVAQGEVTFNSEDLLAIPPEDHAHEGLFLPFRYPVEIPGTSMTNFMRAAINEKRKYQRQEPISAGDFIGLMKEKRKAAELDSKLSNHSVDEGFSGGEEKRDGISQMVMLKPTPFILDETDSGLDVDALRIVTEGVNKLKRPDTSTIAIIHYNRLLDLVRPGIVHVLLNGHIVKVGRPELAREIEGKGYDWIRAGAE